MTLHLTLVLGRSELQNIHELQPVARLENRGKKPLSAVINASPLSHGEYAVEVQDAQGKPVDLLSFGMCGMMAPLMEHVIFMVEPGASVDIPVSPGRGATLAPGSYRVRVSYRAHASDRGEADWTPEVRKRLKHFWKGHLKSEWVPVTIQPNK